MAPRCPDILLDQPDEVLVLSLPCTAEGFSQFIVRKLVDYVMVRAGQEYGIARAKVAAMWMLDQAKPKLDEAKKAAEFQKLILKAQTEFAGQVDGQLEVVGPHLQQINTIYHKHQQMAGAG